MDGSDDLSRALAGVVGKLPVRDLGPSVQRLIDVYRGTIATDVPVLRHAVDVAAYAAYRMPATYAATKFALNEVRMRVSGWQPSSHLDIGGGTGAAAWAAAGVWPGPRPVAIVDWSEPALALGRDLASCATEESLREAQWLHRPLEPSVVTKPADLVTLSYVLGELPAEVRDALIDRIASQGQVVAIVEPGTPAGYARILAARDRLVEAGMDVVAPCPHNAGCPLERVRDWCHFAVRVNRSVAHRQLKDAALPYEDEKFSYVVASRADSRRAGARILRHPVQRKGLVQLRLCTEHRGVQREIVSKREGPLYRAARDANWGDEWPPAGLDQADPG
jgi:ribosomal protein RSM22 (predicted rRNA methylase)